MQEICDFFLNGFLDNLKTIQEQYSTAARIINPDAVKRMSILKKAVSESLKIINEKDITISDKIENNFGWNYTLTIRFPYIGFTGNVMTLFKIAALASDSFEVGDSDEEDTIVMLFTINNVYNIIK